MHPPPLWPQGPVLVAPLLRDLALRLAVLDVALAHLELAVDQQVAVPVFEEVSLWPQGAERVL